MSAVWNNKQNHLHKGKTREISHKHTDCYILNMPTTTVECKLPINLTIQLQKHIYRGL